MASQSSDLGSGQPITALPDSGTPLIINGATTLAPAGSIQPDTTQDVTVGGTAHPGDALALTVTPNGGSPVVLSYAVLSTRRSVTLGGTAQINDTLGLTITPNGGSAAVFSYALLNTDTLQTAAVALAALVNADTGLIAAGITASAPSAGAFNVQYSAAIAPTVSGAVTGTTPTTTLTVGAAAATSASLQIAAVALAALVNASAALLAAGLSATTPSGGVFSVKSIDADAPAVSGAVTGAGATTTLTVAAVVAVHATITPTASFPFAWRGATVEFRVGQSTHVEDDLLAALAAAGAPYTTP